MKYIFNLCKIHNEKNIFFLSNYNPKIQPKKNMDFFCYPKLSTRSSYKQLWSYIFEKKILMIKLYPKKSCPNNSTYFPSKCQNTQNASIRREDK